MDARNFTYLFYGLAAAWLVLAGYVVSLAGRQRKIKRAIENLTHMVEDKDSK